MDRYVPFLSLGSLDSQPWSWLVKPANIRPMWRPCVHL